MNIFQEQSLAFLLSIRCLRKTKLVTNTQVAMNEQRSVGLGGFY